MSQRAPFAWSLAAALVSLAGCSKTAAVSKELNAYSNAQLTAGVGLGDLRLGESLLGDVVAKLGTGSPSLNISDQMGFELRYLNGQLVLLFEISDACQAEAGGGGALKQSLRDLGPYLVAHPACKASPLVSVSVSCEQISPSLRFYKGVTDQGVALAMPIAEAKKHSPVRNGPSQFLAGETAADTEVAAHDGIYFFSSAAPRATDQEIASGRALSPERLQELKEAEKEHKQSGILRMAIFQTER